MNPEAFFLPTPEGQCFCLFHRAVTATNLPAIGRIVYIHPLAEEMNKSRRMAAMQARALAIAGFDVLQIDLLGSGDSSGNFGDASWSAWVHNVLAACEWMNGSTILGHPEASRPALWLWGLRAGCLVAVQAAQSLLEPCNFLFWAPTPSGKVVLQQFLRLGAAADLASGNSKARMDSIRSNLKEGQSVEIAGYQITGRMATELEKASLTPPRQGRPGERVEWFELTTRPDASPTPASAKAMAEWHETGYAVRSHMVVGPSFWQTTEIEDAPNLITATALSLLGQRVL